MKSFNKKAARKKYKTIAIIVGILFTILIIIIIILSIKNHSVNKLQTLPDVVTTTYSDMTTYNGNRIVIPHISESITFPTTTSIETTTFNQNIIVGESIHETISKKRKKSKKYLSSPDTSSEEPGYNINTTQFSETEKPKSTKIPTQKEKGLSSSKRDLIRNCISENISGQMDSNCKNLAIYMANSSIQNTNTALSTLNASSNYNLSSLCISYTLEATDSDSIVDAASNLAEKVGSRNFSKYGIGINCTFSGNKYHINMVICFY